MLPLSDNKMERLRVIYRCLAPRMTIKPLKCKDVFAAGTNMTVASNALSGCDRRSRDAAETSRMNWDKLLDAGCCAWSAAEMEKYRDG